MKEINFNKVLKVSILGMITIFSSCNTNPLMSTPKTMKGQKLFSPLKVRGTYFTNPKFSRRMNSNLKSKMSINNNNYRVKYLINQNNKHTIDESPKTLFQNRYYGVNTYPICKRIYSRNKQDYKYSEYDTRAHKINLAFILGIFIAYKIKNELSNKALAEYISIYKYHFICPYSNCRFLNGINGNIEIQECTKCFKCKNLILAQPREVQIARTAAQMTTTFIPFIGGLYNFSDGIAKGDASQLLRGIFKIAADVVTAGAASPATEVVNNACSVGTYATFFYDICDNISNEEYFDAILIGVLIGLDFKMELSCWNSKSITTNLAKQTRNSGPNTPVQGIKSLKTASRIYKQVSKTSSNVKKITKSLRITKSQMKQCFFKS